MSSPAVLALGGELGFVFALAVELSKRHISVVPAERSQARSTFGRLGVEPELLVVNCRCPGPCPLAEKLGEGNPNLRIAAIVSDHSQCMKCTPTQVTPGGVN